MRTDLQPNSKSDRLGNLLPLNQLGTSGPYVTNLGVGGAHIGEASEQEARAIIKKALEEGVRFFDNAPLYGDGRSEELYGQFLTPKYRDDIFLMSKSLAEDKNTALQDLDDSLNRMKTDYLDLWQIHGLKSPEDVETRVQNGVLDAYLEAQQNGKVKYIGFTGHSNYKAHLKMLEEIEKRGIRMTSAQMPINPADPHFNSFLTNVVPKFTEAGIGILAMKTLAFGRFFGGNIGWKSTDTYAEPVVPATLSVADVLSFVWSQPITTLISGMASIDQVSHNAAIARKTPNLNQSELQKIIDATIPFAGQNLEFYKD
ncbi:aldo/keto reductase [Candidatus Peregrinibacteria bacterium]|nr:aldo/keto reductase [Candidatus Peregrinibacteria bacterium]